MHSSCAGTCAQRVSNADMFCPTFCFPCNVFHNFTKVLQLPRMTACKLLFFLWKHSYA